LTYRFSAFSTAK